MRVRIKKLIEVENPTHPNNKEVGYETVGNVFSNYFNEPKVGDRFCNGYTLTSKVTAILNKNTFRTLNSVYKWEILKDK